MKEVVIPEGLKPNQELIVLVSGGKDSTAMAAWVLHEAKLPNRVILLFCDTGHENPITLAYLDDLAKNYWKREVVTLKPKMTFIELAEKKQIFPSPTKRFCTEHLKVLPLREWIDKQLDEGGLEDPVVLQGVRAQESLKRSKLDPWTAGTLHDAYDADIWRPILDWNVEEVFAIHDRYGIPPNPLYKMGVGRVGCWPCIMVRKSELKQCFETDPELLDRLRGYEERVAAASARNGASFFGPGKVPKDFHDKVFVNPEGKRFTYPSIDAVYRWAMNPDERSLFEDIEGPSCFSQYGLCE